MQAHMRGALLGALAMGLASTAQAQPLNVAVTFSVLGDLVERVAGADAEVSTLTPVGAEVHEWELIPSNFADLEDADLVFYNGYGLEQWLPQVESSVGDGVAVVAVAEASGYPTQPIVTGELAGEPDPHLWMDPRASAEYARVIADALSEARPEAAEGFQARGAALAESLEALHAEIEATLAEIPAEQRLLITSEAAFLYFADAFDFEHDGIWGTNAEDEGTPRQLMRIVDLIEARQPAAIFWESTISDRHVRSVAEETEIAIAGPLYVDSVSDAQGEAPDYAAMLRHNAALLSEALGAQRD
ncbi:metal ABC transporter solute-binding protein, Zn/Mn family [Franzmannia qiaohouensis]|uniref:Zinc ABC transporter substrate-binding protein n=1 Tax=Franzmannia qiaohouensis TaxID=1329370 RepID=A0ABU1HB18_9GAMM|nr:zinc ABC transporter substrate-binding protein [Halomonas qiaohouensis]MDR5904069.1 zinc ABC transporter substrate-binding protein [Halomonas qiaohouensis]